MISPQELEIARDCVGINPIAGIEQEHVFLSGNSPDGSGLLKKPPNGNGGEKTPIKETVVFRPESIGKRYIKNPELTNPPMV